ncbi:MAG TPA: regulatory protein RecX [bacterium]|nr:regulatory protein RecX [bacterium]
MIDSEVPPTISALEKVPRKKEYLIRLSDGDQITVMDEHLSKFSLAAGVEIGPELRGELERAYERAKARLAALRLLRVRPRTEGELRRALILRAFSGQAVAGVLRDLAAQGMVDDRLFARLWVVERAGKGIGRRRILSELKTKHVDEATALEEIEANYGSDDEIENARRVAANRARRMASLGRQKLEQRVYGYLVRQGFSSDIAREATRHALGSQGQKGDQ